MDNFLQATRDRARICSSPQVHAGSLGMNFLCVFLWLLMKKILKIIHKPFEKDQTIFKITIKIKLLSSYCTVLEYFFFARSQYKFYIRIYQTIRQDMAFNVEVLVDAVGVEDLNNQKSNPVSFPIAEAPLHILCIC